MADKINAGIGFDTTDAKANIASLNREIRVLESGFKAASAGMDDWTKSADGNRTRLSTLSGVIDAQKSKVKNLESVYAEVVSTQGENSEAAQTLAIRINNEKAALAKNEAEAKKCADRLDSLANETEDAGSETRDMTKEQDKAADTTDDYGNALKKMSGIMQAEFVGKALKLGVQAFKEFISVAKDAASTLYSWATDVGAMADDTMTLSQVTGISAENLQKWTYASQFVDTEVSTITDSMKRMIMAMGDAADGSATAQNKFSALGVEYRDASGAMRSSEDVFWDAITALGQIENETQRDALAMELFGKTAQELNPLIEAGRESFEAFGLEAESMGIVLSDSALEIAGKFNDAQNKFTAQARGLKFTIGLLAIPAMQGLLSIVTEGMGGINNILADGLQPGDGAAIGEVLISSFEQLKTWLESDDVQTILTAVKSLAIEMIDTLAAYVKSGEAGDTILGGLNGLLDWLLADNNLAKIVTQVVIFAGELIAALVERMPELLRQLWNGIVSGIAGLFGEDSAFGTWLLDNLQIPSAEEIEAEFRAAEESIRFQHNQATQDTYGGIGSETAAADAVIWGLTDEGGEYATAISQGFMAQEDLARDAGRALAQSIISEVASSGIGIRGAGNVSTTVNIGHYNASGNISIKSLAGSISRMNKSALYGVGG